MRALEKGTSYGIMLIGDETWSLAWKCPVKDCNHPMIVNGKCYEHSTGQPRTLTFLPRVMRREDIQQTG